MLYLVSLWNGETLRACLGLDGAVFIQGSHPFSYGCSLGRPVFLPSALKFLRVDSFSLPPHSFILMFVLLFAIRKLSYVRVYFCRLTLVPSTTIPDPLIVTVT